MNRLALALLLLFVGGGAFAVGCAVFKDKPVLVYRYHSEAWEAAEGHTLTVMSSGATRVELEKSEEAPALVVEGKVSTKQVKRLLEALALAGFYDLGARCAKPPSDARRSLTLYRKGKPPTTAQDFWACAPDPELLQGLVTVLDEYAIGKRASLDPAPNPTDEDRLRQEAEAQLAGGQGLVHLNVFGEGRLDREFLLAVGVSRAGVAEATVRRISPATQRSFVESRSARLSADETRALRAKLEALASMDLPRGSCTITGRFFHLSWPKGRSRADVSVVDDCAATPELAREITRDLVTLGERVARAQPKVVSR